MAVVFEYVQQSKSTQQLALRLAEVFSRCRKIPGPRYRICTNGQTPHGLPSHLQSCTRQIKLLAPMGAYFGAASSSGAASPGDVQSAERFVMAALQAPTLVKVKPVR